MNDAPGSPPADEHAGPYKGAGWWRRLTSRMARSPRSREDLLELLNAAREDNLVDADAAAMIRGVFATGELAVRDIMVPRSQMVVLEAASPLDELLRAVVDAGHSRFPVIGDSRDEIVGILLAKDLIKFTSEVPGFAAGEFDLRRWLRPAVFVPDSKRVNMLLKDFRKSRNHMAIVADEYGGVAGLVTIEDVLEEIVGEIDDEFDEAEGAHILKQDDRRYLVNALTPVEEFNEYFGAQFSIDDWDTVGGLVTHCIGHMPRRGESVQLDHFHFNVQRADSRRVHQLQVTLAQA